MWIEISIKDASGPWDLLVDASEIYILNISSCKTSLKIAFKCGHSIIHDFDENKTKAQKLREALIKTILLKTDSILPGIGHIKIIGESL